MKFIRDQISCTIKLKSIQIFLILMLVNLSIILNSCERPTDANQKDDGVPPAVPKGLQISYAFDGEILIEWIPNTDSDLNGYNVYRKTANADYESLTFTTRSYWFDDSLNYEETYFYKISAVDVWNTESEKSTEVFASPVNKYKPQKLRYISINGRNWIGTISIFLNWSPNNESDIAGYNIYRSQNSSFTADSANYIGFTTYLEFNDTTEINLYTDYYYKISVVDKGGLMSDESSIVSDHVNALAEMVFPANDALINYFDYFLIKAIKVLAKYQIIVQTNEYYGEFWSHSFSSSIVDDTIQVKFKPPYLYPYVYYYWRVLTFSNNNSEPNSISPIYKFKVKP